MTKIKLCGLTRPEDIEKANELKPDYIGFVFYDKSSRNVSRQQAAELKALLDPSIQAVGVFVNPEPAYVADLLKDGVIDIAQLHGSEDNAFIETLRALAPGKTIIQAFKINLSEDTELANSSAADYVLLDSGAGSGETFDWSLIRKVTRPYFLAGGLHPGNVTDAVQELHPFAVDVSSGIETDGLKDPEKMQLFVERART
ncbi:MAG: phosphoribosylanthranilate isomerase [Lachnospiraceae bacterium]|nr:phosphoribosylanthranilate isomerase [Lachnospiraceae bacterium]